MCRFRSFLFAAMLLMPAAVRAADVPVTYTVDTTALKLAISGTNLTFELHTNATCTALAHTQILTVDNVSMLSVLKRSKPKNGLKPPKTTDIRATLTGVAPAAPLYAKVTGTGITPIGGACQVQAASTFGSGATGLLVRDTNGTVMGPLQNGALILSDGGTPVATQAQPSGFLQGSSFAYASGDCTGPKLTYSTGFSNNLFVHDQVGVDGTTLWYGPLSAPLTSYNSSDGAPEIPANCVAPGQVFNPPNRCCCTAPVCFTGGPYMGNFAPALSMDISAFVPPFSASFQ
jgi:hypothetical protein